VVLKLLECFTLVVVTYCFVAQVLKRRTVFLVLRGGEAVVGEECSLCLVLGVFINNVVNVFNPSKAVLLIIFFFFFADQSQIACLWAISSLSKLGAIGGSGVVFVSAWAFGSPFFVSAWAFGCPFFVRAVLIIEVIGLVFLVITTETSVVAKDVEECSLFFVQSFS